MVNQARKIVIHVLDSELEALLIEAELIRSHQPYYNSRLKDDKSHLYLAVSKEEFSRLLRLRRTDLDKANKYTAILGPYASAYRLNEVLKIIRPIFTWCNKQNKKDQRPCLYHHLDLCSGACCGKISADAYQANMKRLITFMRGKTSLVCKQLIQEMKQHSAKEEFEAALAIKEQLAMIAEVTDGQYQLGYELIMPNFNQSNYKQATVHLQRLLKQSRINLTSLHRIEAYDVSNTMGQQATVSMVVFIDGVAAKKEYKFFKIRQLDTPNDYAMLQEALTRRQNHPEWGRADLILIDGGKGQLNAVKKIYHGDTPIIGLAKDPDRIVLSNSEVIKLAIDHPTMQLLAQLRDEAHRFAKKQHVRLRTKNLLKTE